MDLLYLVHIFLLMVLFVNYIVTNMYFTQTDVACACTDENKSCKTIVNVLNAMKQFVAISFDKSVNDFDMIAMLQISFHVKI